MVNLNVCFPLVSAALVWVCLANLAVALDFGSAAASRNNEFTEVVEHS
jgi:hypothetical protein